jgi:N-acetylglucosamine-6-phosphate deacetylase
VELLARRYDNAETIRLNIVDGKIAAITPCSAPAGPLPPWIAPGLIDLQVNGYGGQDFSAANITPERVAAIAEQMVAFGVTRFCPTLTTESREVLQCGLRAVAAACDASPTTARRIAGVHLEGPYISPVDGWRGAHPRQHCRKPDWDEFCRLQEASGGRVRILTLAAEWEGAAEFIRRVAGSGVLVAIGHSGADAAQLAAAVDAGARLSTHLGNGCQSTLHRHHNHLWPQLADDRLSASLIVDGQHLPPAVVKTFVRAKSPERCVLVSDLSGYAGLPIGRHVGGMIDVEILPEGRLVIAGQRELLAGAVAPLGIGVCNAMRMAGLTLAQAIAMATAQPAKLIGVIAGEIAVGQPADLVLFDLPAAADGSGPSDFCVRKVVCA